MIRCRHLFNLDSEILLICNLPLSFIAIIRKRLPGYGIGAVVDICRRFIAGWGLGFLKIIFPLRKQSGYHRAICAGGQYCVGILLIRAVRFLCVDLEFCAGQAGSIIRVYLLNLESSIRRLIDNPLIAGQFQRLAYFYRNGHC